MVMVGIFSLMSTIGPCFISSWAEMIRKVYEVSPLI